MNDAIYETNNFIVSVNMLYINIIILDPANDSDQNLSYRLDKLIYVNSK